MYSAQLFCRYNLGGEFTIRKLDAEKTTYAKLSGLHVLRFLLQVNRNLENRNKKLPDRVDNNNSISSDRHRPSSQSPLFLEKHHRA